MAVSVVPTTVCPCQGMANMTRPSAGVRHHDGALRSGGSRAVEHEVDSLARADHRGDVGVGEPAHGVAEGACGVHHDARAGLELAAALEVAAADAVHEAVVAAEEGRDGGVVQQGRRPARRRWPPG